MKDLDRALVEKDVENAYRSAIQVGRPQATITSPHNTDGYAQWDSVRLLLEAKYDADFKSRVPVCNTLGQCLLYLKRFESSGEPLPNVILVGDKNECFVLATSAVKGFLDLPLDWSVAPSSGNPELTRALVEGMNILPYVYDVDGNFKFTEVLAKVETLAEGEQHTVKATVGNMGAIFIYWQNRVFRDSKLTAVEQVDVFLRCLFQPSEVYLHPVKKGVLIVPNYPDGVLINADQYTSFFDHFEQGYKPSEIEAFYACKDRLVEDDARRRQGAFFTPSLWVAEAHKTLDGVLGPKWRQECIVWDPAAGTANLTRDYTFADLIISTAEKPDVQVIKEQGYNPGAAVFQYDFLNPDVGSPFFEEGESNVLPVAVEKQLKEAAKAGKRLVFLMNPPYGEHSIAGTSGESRTGMAKTLVNEAMLKGKMGLPSRQLYAQFMYQCSILAVQLGFQQHTVGLFSMSKFMSSGSYKKFRHWWYDRYEARAAFMFQASHFADVSGKWGISFTVWSHGGHAKTPLDTVTPCFLLDEPKGTFAVKKIGHKAIYSPDGRDAAEWVREPIRGYKGSDAPQMTSGLKVKDGSKKTLLLRALVNLNNDSNNLMKSGTDVFWTSSCSTRNAGVPVLPDNWRHAIALYGARKLVKDHWTIHEDEYLVPNETKPGYEQWVDDCHVYSLLDTKNNCSSMRNVPYKGKTWTLHNHFFWKSHADTLAALDTAKTPTLYRDCKQHPAKDVFGNPVESTPDPYMASVLPKLNLSTEAKNVLTKLDTLWLKSLPMREAYTAGKPELHLLSWDAGVYQLKHLWRDLFPKEWEELQASFKVLADKLRPGVYEHGFLLR